MTQVEYDLSRLMCLLCEILDEIHSEIIRCFPVNYKSAPCYKCDYRKICKRLWEAYGGN